MTNTRAEAFAPASMGNVGVGFDILGLAFQKPGDIVSVERREKPGVQIIDIEGDEGALPRDAKKNTASVVAQAVLDQIGAGWGVNLRLRKGLPLTSGLGSSAASGVAAAMAVNALLDEPLPREALLPACLEGEALVSGYHADNAGPALLGGITLITGTEAHQIHNLPVPESLWFALITPDVSVPTVEARAVLPDQVPFKAVVNQTAGVANLVDALYKNDIQRVAQAMEADGIVEPARAHLMPLLEKMRQTAKRHGALSLVISGAGPTLCAVCDSGSKAEKVSQAMYEAYQAAGIESVARHTQVSIEGARVLSVQ